MPVSLKDAQTILLAAEASARKVGVIVSITVVDNRGDLIASIRMDGARYFTPDISKGKAMAAAVFGVSSATLTERAGSPVFQSLNLMHSGRLVFSQGAVPITQGVAIEGAVGVSGGTPQQDEDIANAGLAAV